MQDVSSAKQATWFGATFLLGGMLGLGSLTDAYFQFFHNIPVRISEETTHVTEPLTPDGRKVDYFAAMEAERYPAEMKTDDNGYRMIVRALGDMEEHGGYNWMTGERTIPSKDCSREVYEKLGLDIDKDSPTLTYQEPSDFIQEYVEAHPELAIKDVRAEEPVVEKKKRPRARRSYYYRYGDHESEPRSAEPLRVDEDPFGADDPFAEETSEPLPEDFSVEELMEDIEEEAQKAELEKQEQAAEEEVYSEEDYYEDEYEEYYEEYYYEDYEDDRVDREKVEEWPDDPERYLEARIYAPWTADDLPVMAEWLEANSPALDLVAEAVQKPVFCTPLVLWDDELPFCEGRTGGAYAAIRGLVRGLAVRANYRLGTGDIDGAVDDIIACKRLSTHCAGQGLCVESLVGMAIEGISLANGIAVSPEHQPTDEQIQRLMSLWDGVLPTAAPESYMPLERLGILEMLQPRAASQSPLCFRKIGSSFEGVHYFGYDWNIVMRRINQWFDEAERGASHDVELSDERLTDVLRRNTRSELLADVVLSMLAYDMCREAHRRLQCCNQMHRITLAMLLYEREHGVLPPAYTTDEEGRPLHSWRVLLLPYLGQGELYGKLRLDEPWDSEHNRRFHDEAVALYQCPSLELDDPSLASYAVVMGEKTPFGAGEGRPLDNFTPNTVLVVERTQPICWMDPTQEVNDDGERHEYTDMPVTWIVRHEDAPSLGVSSKHPGGCNMGIATGGVRFFSETTYSGTLLRLYEGRCLILP